MLISYVFCDTCHVTRTCFEVKSPSFLFPFLNLSEREQDTQEFTLGFLCRQGWSSDWLPSLQVTLWQRFIELLKSGKNNETVATMIQTFGQKVTIDNFADDITECSTGYDKKVFMDMSLLSVCILMGSDESEHNHDRDVLCAAAANMYKDASCHLSIAVNHSSNYKALWTRVTTYGKQAVDNKQVVNKVAQVLKTLEELKEAGQGQEEKLQTGLVSKLLQLCPEGAPAFLQALRSQKLDTEAEKLEVEGLGVSQTLGEFSWSPFVACLDKQWTQSPSDFDFEDTTTRYNVAQDSIVDLEPFRLQGATTTSVKVDSSSTNPMTFFFYL